ncbi:ABC transporter permease [Fulvivirgaceae bacterium PWU5]|uniref:ABC transporter permease n=2 Tax=Dawidia cretensis TaxID=2782350 RepID=A0AAP2GVD5_9BACT|nr:ABC transporter permease [Dawidia cretensis]
MPPKILLRFFQAYCHPRLHRHIEGDLIEVYNIRLKQSGKHVAAVKLLLDIIFLFRPGIIRPAEGYQNVNTYGMYKSYFKIGWRTLLHQKRYSIINISGLAIGMAAAILNGLWIWHELSYNKYFDNYKHVAQVTESGIDEERGGRWTGNTMTYPLGTELTTTYGQHFERVTRVSWGIDNILAAGETKLSAKGFYVDQSFPEVFSFRMIAGHRAALTNPTAVLISASLANALFAGEDPINKVITISNKMDVKVGGVFEDFPDNTKWTGTQFFLPWELFLADYRWIEERALTDWRNHFLQIYVELPKGASFDATANNIQRALQFAPEDAEQAKKSDQRLELYPMSRWHLYPTNVKQGQYEPIFMLKLVGAVGVFILLLACINFVNLSTARSEKRAKEVGIRKTIGSMRTQLIQQFFSESLLLVFFAFVMALILATLCLPYFNLIAAKNIQIPWTKLWFWFGGISFVLITGLLAGSWPAMYLSSFNPVRALKGSFKLGRFHAVPRRVLVVFQFSISVILVIGTMIVYQQIQFVKDRPVGYEREGLIMIRKKSADFNNNYDVLRNELKNTGAVLEISESMGSMTEVASGNNGWDWKGHDPAVDKSFATLPVSHMHGQTVGWQFLQGRDFDIAAASDSSAIVINESALALMKLTHPLGEPVTWTWRRDGRVMNYKIIGVVRDMVMASPYAPAEPTIFYVKGFNGNPNWINLRVNPQVSMSEALPKIEAVFKKIIPSAPFEYTFADTEYAMKFGKEERIGNLAGIFAGIAIAISCLGLLGLASFVAEQRTKEIGIRKVLGASVIHVWQLLSTEFLWVVLGACLIGSPLAYYLLSAWLQKFTYHAEISWWTFVFTTAAMVAVTLITVSHQSIRTALMNPVKSLKSE